MNRNDKKSGEDEVEVSQNHENNPVLGTIQSLFVAPYTPESNGMSEAFVATMKRDYIYTARCDSAQTVMKLFKNWIEDYNNVAPHSGLGMKSPVEYRRLMNLAV